MRTMIAYLELKRPQQVRRLRSAVVQAFQTENDSVLSCRVLDHQHNTTFRVETKNLGLSFVRISKLEDRTESNVDAEVRWLESLAQQGIPVLRPVPWGGCRATHLIEDLALGSPRILARFSWVDGTRFDHPSAEQWRAIGTTMARLHVAEQTTPSVGLDRWDVDVMAGNTGSPESSMQDAEDVLGTESRRLLEQVNERYLQAKPSIGPNHLIHGDIHQWNVLFEQDSFALIDFDDCGYAPALYDFVVPVREMEEMGLVGMETALLEGYRTVQEVPDGYVDWMPLLKTLRAGQLVLWAVSERHNPSFASWWEEWSAERMREVSAAVRGWC